MPLLPIPPIMRATSPGGFWTSIDYYSIDYKHIVWYYLCMRGRGRYGGGRQRRGRHMLRPTLLFLMHQRPAHGYDLIERLKAFDIHDIDPSLIYRALRDMEAEGWIQSSWEKEETQGPPRRIYTLTREGDQILASYLEDLKRTRERIDHLIQSYEKHMKSGTGDFHQP